MRDSFLAIFAALSLLWWASGCATQTDIQQEQQAREALRAQIADNKASLDEVRREIQKVRGEVEEVRYRLDRVSRERSGAGPQLKILEDRIDALEKQFKVREEAVAPPPGVTGETPLSRPIEPPSSPGLTGPSPPSGASPAPPATPLLSRREEVALARESPEVQDEYKLALRALSERQYDRAIQQFRTFQRKNPNSELADDAQYWIGEGYFEQKDYNRAILEFNDVLKYRRGDRIPAALLRQGQAFLEIGDKTDARLIWQKLVNDHPNSEQAKEARERLQNLGR